MYAIFKIFGVGISGPCFETVGGAGSGGGSDSKGELDKDLSDLGGEGETDGEDEGEEESDEEDEGGKVDSGEEEESEDLEDGDDAEEEDGDAESEEDSEDDPEKGKDVEESETGRVTFKTLKKEYPDLFKKHPELRTAFFEHPQYADIFPDLPSARDAASKAQEYEALEASMVGKGDPSVMLKALDENNPRVLNKIVEAFPEALRDIDPKYYTALATPIIEELLWHATKYADKIGGDPGRNLRLAAKHVANYVWANGGDIPDISARASKAAKDKEPSDAEKALVAERAVYARREYARAADDLESEVTKAMAPVYSRKLDDLTSFERKTVIKETKLEVDRLLSKDEGFQRTLKALWKRAYESGYSRDSKTRIRRAWLERATVLAPKVRNRLRHEAISGRRKTDPDEKIVSGKKRQFTQQGGRAPGRQPEVRDPHKIDWRKTSDMDILNK